MISTADRLGSSIDFLKVVCWIRRRNIRCRIWSSTSCPAQRLRWAIWATISRSRCRRLDWGVGFSPVSVRLHYWGPPPAMAFQASDLDSKRIQNGACRIHSVWMASTKRIVRRITATCARQCRPTTPLSSGRVAPTIRMRRDPFATMPRSKPRLCHRMRNCSTPSWRSQNISTRPTANSPAPCLRSFCASIRRRIVWKPSSTINFLRMAPICRRIDGMLSAR